jgi:hypothetical protein
VIGIEASPMDAAMASLLRHPSVALAAALCLEGDERTLAWQMELTAIPAPGRSRP